MSCWQFSEAFHANYAAEDSLLQGGMPAQSTVRFKAPGSALSMQRVESDVVPQSKSKVQIPGLASTSSKGPNLLKKRLKKKRKDAKLVAQSAAPRISRSPAHVENLGSALHSLDPKAAGGKASVRPKLTHLPGDESKPSGQASPDRTGERQICAILENPVSCTNPTAKNQIKRKSKSSKKLNSSKGTDDAAEVLETSSERVISSYKSGTRTPPPSETSFTTLLSCISRILGKDEGFYDLQITPVRTGGGESFLDSDFQTMVDSSDPQNLDLTEVVTAFENCYDVISPEADAIYLSPAASLILRESNEESGYGIVSEDNIARMLIGEIDLHVELENYLRQTECFTGMRNRTKNTLQCNLYEDRYPLNGSGLDLQNNTNEFFEVTEIKSNSTFASATSICTQQDGDTNKLHVFLDRKRDMTSMSEEYFDSRNTKVFISETQFTDKVGDIRKIKSDNDPKKIQQEAKLKSSIKRTFGKTSFQSSRADEEKPWAMPPLRSDPSTENSVDYYEKILPFGCNPNKSCDEVKKRNSLLHTNSVSSLSGESLLTTIRKSASDSDRCQERTEPGENAESDGLLELQSPGESSSKSLFSKALPQLESKRRSWSPSLQELIEIYNDVLKHNKKIKSNSRTSVSRCFSSHSFSFLNEKLKEKERKAHLVMLSRNLSKKLKASEVWKPGRQKNDNTLEEYVTMFQEILKSSLTISQIARLNNIISGLQEYSEKNYDFVKNMKAKVKEDKPKKTEEFATEETAPVPRSAEEKVPPPKKPRKVTPSEKAIRPSRPSSSRCQVRRKKTQNTKPNTEELVVPMEEITKIELTSPTELESILQSCFAAESVDGTRPRNSNDKILVTVKLRGNQVLVSRLTYFRNEQALSSEKTQENGTSELIIENVTKEKVKDVSRKKTKIRKPREVNKLVESEKPKNETKVNVESKKVKKHPKAATTPPEAKSERYIEADGNSFFPQEFEQSKPLLPFEYDQMQLRAQHPIEAIIESSESKISEHVESSDDDHPQLEPPPEKKILLTDIQKTTLKEALEDALAENVYSKDLSCDFGWSDENVLDKSLSRTKSYVINRETLKKQTFAKEPPNHAETVRSLSDLNNNPKSRRKGRRKATSYMCYPSILNLQRKAPTVKKKSKKQSRQKNRSVCNSRMQSECVLYQQQQGVSKRSSKELSSEVAASRSETPQMPALTGVEEDLDRAEQLSVGTAGCDSEEVVLDSCSMELLYYDSENPSTSVTPKESAPIVKTTSKANSSEQVALLLEGKGSSSNRPSVVTVEGIKGSPIAIHPPRNASKDTIFHSVMIHSDSFLKKCYSSLALTQANLNCFLKSSSDMEFYPGRVSSSDNQQNPFVKFVLTPSQNADAGLPPNQVQVVDKKFAAEDAALERAKSASEEIDEKIPLISIEKFIRKLSKGKKKEKPKPKEAGKSEAEKNSKTPPTASKQGQRKKSPDQQSRPKTTDRKPYHECQKRRLVDKTKGTEKKARATDSKTKLKENAPPEPPPENSEMNLLSLKKFMLTLSQIMESYENFSKESTKNQTEGKYEKGGAEDSIVAETDPKTEGISTAGHVEKGTNTIPETKCSLTRVSDSTADTPEKNVQPVKSAVTQTDDVPVIKDKDEEEPKREVEKRKTCDKASCTPKVVREPTPPRKPKTLKIKIHCDDRSNCKDGSKAGKNPVPGKGKPQRFGEKIGLLDSLVLAEPEGGTLERRNSTYFDATDKHTEAESEGDSQIKANSQQEFMAYWATVDPVNLSGGLFTTEESDGSPSSEGILPNDTPPEGSAEQVFDEILKSLQDGKICRSLTLLYDFLGKADFSASRNGDSDRLRKVLLLVSSKCKNLMIDMEKNAWVKVLSLLEDMSQMLSSEDEDSQKALLEKIKGLNDSRLVDLRNFCSSLSQTTNSRGKNVFCRIKDSFNYLRNRISLSRSRSANSTQSTMHLPETPETIDRPDKNPLQELRKQIQRQKTYIEFLLSADCSVPLNEIQDVERKVVEKMKTFAKIFSLLREGGSTTDSPPKEMKLPSPC